MFKILRRDLLFIVAVAAVFLSLSYAIGFVTDRSTNAVEMETAFRNGQRPAAQPTTARLWRKASFEKLAVLNSRSLKDPAKMQVENSADIFVLDWSDLLVKEFSPDGKLVRAFGKEGVFANPTGFALDSGGNMWVCDLKLDRVGIFNVDGSKRLIKPIDSIYRMVAIGDVMVTMVTLDHSRLFATYDLAGHQLNSFGELLEDQSDKGLVLDGDIVADAENRGIIYGGRYLGILGSYDLEGKQRYLVQTIDSVPQPTVLNIDGRMRKVKPNTARPVLSLSILDNELYVLSGVSPDGTEGSAGKIMDVYNKQDGHYLYSWELPLGAVEATVTSNYIYIRSNREVTVWSFKSNT